MSIIDGLTTFVVLVPLALACQEDALPGGGVPDVGAPARDAAAAIRDVGTAADLPPEPARLGITPASADFGSVQVGRIDAPFLSFSASNSGGSLSGEPSVTIEGAGFLLVTNNCMAPIPPGAMCVVQVRFRPVSEGPAVGGLTVLATPGGSASAPLSGTGLGAPPFLIAPRSRDFGTVLVGTSSAPAAFTVTNPGAASATGLLVQTSPGFAVPRTGNRCGSGIPAMGICEIDVVFAPEAPGMQTGRLVVSSAGIGAEAMLAGAGLAGDARLFASPTMLTFSGAVGRQSSMMVTVGNSGSAPTGQLTGNLDGTGTSHFSTLRSTCGPPIGPGATCSLQVVFSPLDPGEKIATFEFSANPGGTARISLVGQAAPRP